MKLLEYQLSSSKYEVLEKWLKDEDGVVYKCLKIGNEWTPIRTHYKNIPFIKIDLREVNT